MPSSDTPYQAMGASPSKTMDYIKFAGAGAVLFLIGGAVDHLVFGGTKTVLPNDYMPKCSGSETLGVSLEEACERINLAGGGAGHDDGRVGERVDPLAAVEQQLALARSEAVADGGRAGGGGGG